MKRTNTIKRKLEGIKTLLRRGRQFGLVIPICDILTLVCRNKGLRARLDAVKHRRGKKYIRKQYNNIIQKYQNQDNRKEAVIEETSRIWIFWWQGVEEAPEIVRCCIHSIYEHAGSHPVTIVDQWNLPQFLQLPQPILDKAAQGRISFTHLSDIIQCGLLYEYGGIWMDATLFATDRILEEMEGYRFYTAHPKVASDHVCKGLWTGFFLASGRQNQLFAFLQEMLYKYWETEEVLICYLLIDCILSIGYEDIPQLREMIDEVPDNNGNIFALAAKLNQAYVPEELERIKEQNTLHKLSYKRKFLPLSGGQKTYYQALREQTWKRVRHEP